MEKTGIKRIAMQLTGLLILALLIVLTLALPVNAAGEDLGSCDFSTQCVNKSLTSFIRTYRNVSGDSCTEYPNNGTMFFDTNDGGGSPFFNLSFNNTPNAN